jgi:hypothetical protein
MNERHNEVKKKKGNKNPDASKGSTNSLLLSGIIRHGLKDCKDNLVYDVTQ